LRSKIFNSGCGIAWDKHGRRSCLSVVQAKSKRIKEMSAIPNERFPRGSEWRQWDLHIHTPASFHWEGARFDSDPGSTHNARLVDEMIHALNAAEPAVFAIMDYWTFDGWLALKRRLKEPGAPSLCKKVFPGIELRLVSPTPFRLNAHVLFSDELDEPFLRDFKSRLRIDFDDSRPLSDDSLIRLARNKNASFLQVSEAKFSQILNDDREALLAGSKIAEINCDSYRDAIQKVPDSMAIGFMGSS
jgi:hypothetical protein